MSQDNDPTEVPLLTAIQDIALWATNHDDCPKEISEALSLIESICRHSAPVWDEAEAEKYGLGKN